MIMKKKYISILLILPFMVTLVSCLGDLDTKPLDQNELIADEVYKSPENYEAVLAKVYAILVVSGQEGPAGKPDISDLDEGMSQYLRQYWNCQELPTEEAICAWADGSLRDFHNQNWTSNMEFVSAMYNRIYSLISISTEFIRNAEDNVVAGKGFSAEDIAKIKVYRAEARALRAMAYLHAIDMFGNVPFVDETTGTGAVMPQQIKRADLFNWLEKELIDLQNNLAEPRTNVYGRLDKAFAWTLLAKLYLNAEVYAGVNKYTDCITYCKQIMAGGYSLHSNYAELFMADNDRISNEFIFAIPFDGLKTQSYGGTGFIINAAVGGNVMKPADYGSQNWGGNRSTKQLPEKFATEDKRAMFFTEGQKLEINNVGTFTEGYAVIKFTNLKSDGTPGKSAQFADTDFPLFRLADIYLMYAEAVARGGQGGDKQIAVGYINELRKRAYGDNSGNISDYDLNFILDERARELYWECHRRTDLIRFGKFSNTTYTWEWKGGIKEGKAVDAKYDLFAIPSSDMGANTNLVQNPGY